MLGLGVLELLLLCVVGAVWLIPIVAVVFVVPGVFRRLDRIGDAIERESSKGK